MENQPQGERGVKNTVEKTEVFSHGCSVILLEGKAERGEPGVPDANLLREMISVQKNIKAKYPNAKEAIRTFHPFYDFGNIFEFVSKDTVLYTQVDIINEEQRSSRLPENAGLVTEQSDYAVLHLKWPGPMTKLNKQASRSGDKQMAESLAQSCSFFSRKYGKDAGFSWIMAPGMMNGGILVATKKT